MEHRGFLGPWKYSVQYHNGGYMDYTFVQIHRTYITKTTLEYKLETEDYDVSM